MAKKFYLFIIGLIFTSFAFSQKTYPDNEFISPVEIPIKLSGTFGELRSNHFHSGMDIKTGEIEGLKVFSIGDGYISRIKVQAGGYGKAIYITHTNGFVSVYAHLSKYNNGINEYVKTQQYQKKSYTLDLYFEPDQFPVHQGDIIAYTGNTGRSGGPHLHFEIRDAKTQKPINPLLFGYQVKDNAAPVINYVKVYPFGKQSGIENTNEEKGYFTVKKDTTWLLKGNDTISAYGQIYFGINTIDYFNGRMNKNGVYKISMYVDNVKVYEHDVETFSFDETRYINSLLDYKEYKTNNRQMQKTRIEPNNKLSIYNKKTNNGILNVKTGKKYQITYKVSDVVGNTALLNFWIKGKESQPMVSKTKPDKKQLFSYQKNNVFKTEDIVLEVPAKALYDSLSFHYNKSSKREGFYAPIHALHFDYVPLHQWCSLAIWPDSIPSDLYEKAIIVKIEDNNEISAAGGQWEDGFIKSRIREFGDYSIMVDTIAPEIKPFNIQNNKSLLAQNTIKLKISDKLSGIDSYTGTLNGEWILMEYDEKNDLLIYYFDKYLKEGENIFKLEVYDNTNNYSIYEALLHY
jgi:murein DD-endopeptidase MepM/ murein hydrolase activator NlpD